MVKYFSSKKYGHERGLSAAFRQWKADSHCKYIHGYSLEFEFKFGANELDERNWVVDFGGLKELENWLRNHFDHKTLVASDDPELAKFSFLFSSVRVRICFPSVNCILCVAKKA